jgi:hypothetical protein
MDIKRFRVTRKYEKEREEDTNTEIIQHENESSLLYPKVMENEDVYMSQVRDIS